MMLPIGIITITLVVFLLTTSSSFASFAPKASLKSMKSTGDNSTAFDMFVFAYSWTPEFCYGETNSWPGCENPEDFWKTHFTLHGLWPQYSAGGYPSTCTNEAFDPNTPITIGMDTMTEYWPNVQSAVGDSDYDSFWEHEWSKHGTCTGLSQIDYFSASLALIQTFGTPASVTKAVGGTLSAATLRNDFGGASYVALQCESGSFLSGAFTCWTNEGGKPGKQMQCAGDVQNEDTCSASTLTVPTL